MASFIVIAIIVIVGILIYLFTEFKRSKDKFMVKVLILLVLLSYFGFSHILKDNNIPLNSPSNLIKIGKVYFSWLGSIFLNLKSLTTKAITMDWSGGNKTS